jgi:hypothetical protein
MEKPFTSGLPVPNADGKKTQKVTSKKRWKLDFFPSLSLKDSPSLY